MKNALREDRKKYLINPLIIWGITAGLTAAVFGCAYILFLDLFVSALIALGCILPLRIKVRKEAEKRYEKIIRKEFVSCLVSISGSLSSGLRLEQCITEIALSESDEFSHIRNEFLRMSKLVSLNLPAEKAFSELARRIPVRDIRLFSQALDYAVPSGVNLIELVRSFSSGMRIRNDVEAEISKTLNLPKYNNRIITVMPFAMIALMRGTAGDYLSNLDTGTGFIVKTAAMIIIGAAILLGEVLGDIKYAQ